MLLFENWTLTNFSNIAQYLSIKKVAFLFLYYQNEPKNEQYYFNINMCRFMYLKKFYLKIF